MPHTTELKAESPGHSSTPEDDHGEQLLRVVDQIRRGEFPQAPDNAKAVLEILFYYLWEGSSTEVGAFNVIRLFVRGLLREAEDTPSTDKLFDKITGLIRYRNLRYQEDLLILMTFLKEGGQLVSLTITLRQAFESAGIIKETFDDRNFVHKSGDVC